MLFLGGSSGGYGADRQLELLATGLDPARYRPLVVLPERGELGGRLDGAGIETVISPLAVIRRQLLQGRGVAATSALLRRNVRELGGLARRRRVSIVHSNSSLILAGQGVAKRAGAAHVLHVREIYVEGDPPDNPLWPLLCRRLLRADAVVCVSNAAAVQFPSSERVLVVYDGIARGLSRLTRTQARQAIGIEATAFVVATLGRISDWKGQDVLVHALADPLLAEIDAVGLVAGDAAPHQKHFEAELIALRGSLGLEGRVRLLGFRDDVDVLLAAADVVAVPSTYPDSLPNSSIEAAATGLPVVATDTGGQREIIRDGVTGRIVPPRDPRALACALRELADDPDTAARLGRAAATDVRRRFDSARMLDEIQEHYDRLLASRRAGPPAWLLPVKGLAVSHPTPPDLRAARQASWLDDLGYRSTVLRSPGLRSAPGLVARALWERPALVLVGAAVHAPALAAIKRLLGRQTIAVADVVGLHSLEIDQAMKTSWSRSLVRPAWTRLERLLVRSADIVLAINDRHAQLLRRRYRASAVFTLRDGAEPEVTAIPPVERASIGLDSNAVAIGFAGSLVYSRLEPLFAAWAELSDAERAGACLVIVGDGPDLPRYRARVAKAGWLGQSVLFLGGLPRVDALAVLAACDVGYSDCWTDAGFPTKLFECMALGLPIVTEGKPQATEVLEEGREALLYRSTGELADQLRRLVADPELRARLGGAALHTYREGHTLERRQREFEEIVEGSPRPPRNTPPRPEPTLVSVVMPIRNEASHVREQLAALAEQKYAGAWELVVVDDGCTDGSITIVEEWRSLLPTVRIVRTSRRGLNNARGTGAAAASGELLAFCDADDVVTKGWLDALVEAARDADLVGGALDLEALNDPDVFAWRPGEPLRDLPVAHDFLPYVPGGNCAVWAEVARDIGWDDSFRFGSSDVEFAWRAHLGGYRLAFAREAVVRQRFRPELGATLLQHVRYGASSARLYRAFRGHGMQSPGVRGALGTWRALLRSSPGLLRSPGRRGHWLRFAAVTVGRLAGSVRHRVLFP